MNLEQGKEGGVWIGTRNPVWTQAHSLAEGGSNKDGTQLRPADKNRNQCLAKVRGWEKWSVCSGGEIRQDTRACGWGSVNVMTRCSELAGTLWQGSRATAPGLSDLLWVCMCLCVSSVQVPGLGGI